MAAVLAVLVAACGSEGASRPLSDTRATTEAAPDEGVPATVETGDEALTALARMPDQLDQSVRQPVEGQARYEAPDGTVWGLEVMEAGDVVDVSPPPEVADLLASHVREASPCTPDRDTCLRGLGPGGEQVTVWASPSGELLFAVVAPDRAAARLLEQAWSDAVAQG